MKWWLLLIIITNSVKTLHAQELRLFVRKSIEAPATVSYDRKHQVYIAYQNGRVTQYSPKGDSLFSYSPVRAAAPTALEAWQTLRILLFYADYQEYTVLDRFLGNHQTYKVPTQDLGFAQLLTYGSDNSLWIFDNTDYSLKKLNLQTQQLITSTPLDLLLASKKYDLGTIREYQNQIFLIDKDSGILIFDNFGNFKKKLDIRHRGWIGFFGDSLYYLKDSSVNLIHLYASENKIIDLPIESNLYKYVVITGPYLWLIAQDHLLIYEYH